jgi:type IV pilus assembly protein PilQ
MVDLNLLPWREGSYRSKLKRMRFLCMGIFSCCGFLVLWYWVQAQQRIQIHIEEKQQLQQDLKQLRALYRRQLLTVHEQGSVKEQHSHSNLSRRNKRPVLLTKILVIHYAKALDLASIMKDKTNALLSRHGHIAVDQRTNVLWVEDTAEHLQKLQTFVQHFDIPAQQIIIEARLVNMNQEAARDLGVRLGLVAPSQSNPIQGAQPSMPGAHLGLDMVARTLDATAATLGFTQALLTSQRLLDFELSALESEGKAKVIASPRLITSNQIPAVIEAGEDIPYQEFSINGNTSVAFKKAVLRLQVVPQITGTHELMMSLVINQDADSGKRVQGVPIIATKSIETRILIKHGQTVVLGGIYQEDRNRQIDQIPYLGDIPFLGDLFQRKHMRLRHEALLIFITPRIVSHG